MAFGDYGTKKKSIGASLGSASVSTRPGNRGPRGPEEHPRQSTGLAGRLTTPAEPEAPTAGKRKRIKDVLG